MSTKIKETILITIFLLVFAFDLFAPANKSLVILNSNPEKPFTKLIYAVGMVETRFDTLAYNIQEEAAGFFQIRPIRVDDYNKRTGSNYSYNDMFNYKIAEKVFLYYASIIGPGNFEKIAKSWNGSGPLTISYWNNVKRHL
jgi:hypothetical protein